jgi:hypothetical protein
MLASDLKTHRRTLNGLANDEADADKRAVTGSWHDRTMDWSADVSFGVPYKLRS